MGISQDKLNELRRQAAELRWHIVTMMGPNKAHHFGGSLSAADIIAALYFYKLRYDPLNPDWPERDRFLMSKGHSVPVQYAALAMLGVFPLGELPTLKQLGSRLQGSPIDIDQGHAGALSSQGFGDRQTNPMCCSGDERRTPRHLALHRSPLARTVP